tara:strand:+ start:1031 stop:2023 length:993 start_codon:yes stop_codon:yes gene_type:complete
MVKDLKVNHDEYFLNSTGQDLVYKQPPKWTKALVWSIAGSFGFGLIFACFARIDEVVIARGELQAIGAERPIKSPISGIISQIYVSEGKRVNTGDKLIEFDSNVLFAREESLKAKLEELIISKKLEENILKEVATLAEIGGIQMIQYLQQEKKVNEVNFEVKQIKAKIKEINFDKRKTIILSPVKGKVFNLIPQSIGYASTLGENLMNVVPEGDVEAKVFLSNNDVGFVKNEMEADIRVDAYPFTQFGSIKGKLKFVGDEVLPSDFQNPEPRFPAYINLSQQYLIKNGNTYKVRSGQSVSVNLKVRDKPVISLLTDAIDKAFDSLKGIKN